MHNQLDRCRADRGQVTILLALVLVAVVLLGVAIAIVGDAMIHRAKARTVADAVALASVAEPAVVFDLEAKYRSEGASIELRSDHARVGSGPSQAAAWAEVIAGDVATAPVVRAIVARIEQLRDTRFTTLRWHQHAVELRGADAAIMRSMAGGFGMCEQVLASSSRFQQC